MTRILPGPWQVTESIRVTCLDGREFIRSAPREAFHNPFPPFTGLVSKRQARKESRHGHARPEPTSPPLPPRQRISHFIMNLPDSAIEFLGAFRGILSSENLGGDGRTLYGDRLPMVHCHCFTRCMDPEEATKEILQVCNARVVAIGTDT